MLNKGYFRIAWRYFYSKKSYNAIQWITGISIAGLTFGTAAIIIILSVFNGFESLLLSLYNNYNPDLKISAIQGKTFTMDASILDAIHRLDGVRDMSRVMEDKAMLVNGSQQEVAWVKGVDSTYARVTKIDESRLTGDYLLNDTAAFFAYMGAGLAYQLGVNINDPLGSTQIYIPNLGAGSLGPKTRQLSVYTRGTFAIQQEEDNRMVLIPLDAIWQLYGKRDTYSALELSLEEEAEVSSVKAQLLALLGEAYRVEDRNEQEEATIKVMRIEKWMAFLILVMALILIALNLVGAIWMIVLDKRRDILVLRAMGATNNYIRNIYTSLGLIISLIGFSMGLIMALILYILQKKFDLISMGPNAIVSSYPLEIMPYDIPLVFIVVLMIGIMGSLLPALRASQLTGRIATR